MLARAKGRGWYCAASPAAAVANVVRPGVGATDGWRRLTAEEEREVESEPLAWMRKRANAEGREKLAYEDLAAPFPNGRPAAAFAIGLNYKLHAKETAMDLPKFPIVIGKAATAAVGPLDDVKVPKCADPTEVDLEVELAVVVGKRCQDVSPAEALDYVLGFTVANDVTARKWQGKKGGGQWVRSKSFATFMPLGPVVRLAQGFDPANATLWSSLHKAGTPAPTEMQRDNTRNLIFSAAELVSFVSQDTVLDPWTVILTGTPAGVGYTRKPPVYLAPGDEMDVAVDGIGVLRSRVVAAA